MRCFGISFSSAGGLLHLQQDKLHLNQLRGCLVPSSAPPPLSWSLLSAHTEVFDPPSEPQSLGRWRHPYIYVQYGTCLVVYVYVCLLLACDPGLLNSSISQYQSWTPSPP